MLDCSLAPASLTVSSQPRKLVLRSSLLVIELLASRHRFYGQSSRNFIRNGRRRRGGRFFVTSRSLKLNS